MTHRILVRAAQGFLAAIVLAAASTPAQAADAPAAPFSTISDVCSPAEGPVTVTGHAVGRDHDLVIVRYAAQSGPITIDDHALGADEVVWNAAVPLHAGDVPAVDVDCSKAATDVPYTVELRDQPKTPVTFTGRGGDATGGVLTATFGAAGRYVADVTVQDGRVTVGPLDGGDSAPVEVGEGSATVDLGQIAAGTHDLPVRAVPGSTPRWEVTLRALPVTITGLTTDHSIVSSVSGPLGITFTTDADALVRVDVRYAAGRMSTIDSNQRGPGTHVVTWNPGYARDGDWTIVVSAKGAGGSATATVPVTIDRTGPAVAFFDGPLITPADGIGVALRDAHPSATGPVFTSPVGDLVITLQDAGVHVVRGPGGRWPLGPLLLHVAATDAVGNHIERDTRFDVVATLGTPCGTTAAKRAIGASANVMRALRRTPIAGGRPPQEVYRVDRVLCRDLDGDAVPDMAILLRAIRDAVRTPTPVAIFLGTARDPWRAAFVTTRYRVRKVGLHGPSVVLRTTAGALTVTRIGRRWAVGSIRP